MTFIVCFENFIFTYCVDNIHLTTYLTGNDKLRNFKGGKVYLKEGLWVGGVDMDL